MSEPLPLAAMPSPRRHSQQVLVGGVAVGGTAPVVVQSMTTTDPADIAGTARQVAELARAGSELVRITVNTFEAAAAVPRIRERLELAHTPMTALAAVGAAGAVPPATSCSIGMWMAWVCTL